VCSRRERRKSPRSAMGQGWPTHWGLNYSSRGAPAPNRDRGTGFAAAVGFPRGTARDPSRTGFVRPRGRTGQNSRSRPLSRGGAGRAQRGGRGPGALRGGGAGARRSGRMGGGGGSKPGSRGPGPWCVALVSRARGGPSAEQRSGPERRRSRLPRGPGCRASSAAGPGLVARLSQRTVAAEWIPHVRPATIVYPPTQDRLLPYPGLACSRRCRLKVALVRGQSPGLPHLLPDGFPFVGTPRGDS